MAYGTYMIGDCISCIMIGCVVRVYIAGSMATGVRVSITWKVHIQAHSLSYKTAGV